jgi:predicted RNase H-like HicB family nuclease
LIHQSSGLKSLKRGDDAREDRMKQMSILVRATWDDEAGVWVAESSDINGLATEAETLEDLRSKILVMIPELIELNGIDSDLAEIPVHILAQQYTRIANPAAASA